MPRYILKTLDGRVIDSVSWNKKSHAEAWIQHHIKLHGGLDWRDGGLFKVKNGEPMEVVWSKSGKSVDWRNVKAASIDEYDPLLTMWAMVI